MVKRTLVLVLLQICVCYKLNMNLNEEIMRTLKELKTSLKSSSSENVFVPGTYVLVPGRYMETYPFRCVSTFSQELKNLLRNMTTHNDQLQKLNVTLMELEKDARDDDQCTMIQQKNTMGKNLSWINKYTHFLKKLNSCSPDQCSV